MAYTHEARGPGQLILSKDWNDIGQELQRVAGLLEQDEKKQSVGLPIPVRIYGKGVPRSPLSVAGGVAVGGTYAVQNPAPANGLIVEGSVGIGTAAPDSRAQLQVSGGAIMPAAGDAPAAGILFPSDPGGGGGDSAWIRYFARTGQGEATTLEIGVSNDPADHIALMPSGNVGIGTREPGQKLQVEGDALLNGSLTVRDDVQFAARSRQMLNLWKREYGIGIQAFTHYFRTAGNFAWFKGGTHNDASLNGGGGTLQMAILENGNLGVGTAGPEGRLHVVSSAQEAGGGAVIVGPTAGSNLRLGYHADYSWMQSHGAKPLKINPLGNSVVLGEAFTVNPADRTLGWGNGNQLQGDQGGSIELGGNNDLAGTGTPYIDFHFKGKKQDFNTRLINDADGQLTAVGVLHVAGDALKMDANKEIVFAENGQIRSSDNNHRILFRRSEDKLELREYGEIVFSPGATAGLETAKMRLKADGTAVLAGALSAAALRTRVYSAGGTQPWIPSNANTWADVPDLVASVVVTDTVNAIVLYQITMGMGDMHMVTRLVIDNKEPTVRARAIHGNTVYGSPGATWIGSLTPGTHAVKVQFRTPMLAQVNNPAADWQGRYLHVLLLGDQ